MPKAMAVDSAVRLIEWFMNAPPEEWKFIISIFFQSGNGNYPK
jgi:hypothetical protein